MAEPSTRPTSRRLLRRLLWAVTLVAGAIVLLVWYVRLGLMGHGLLHAASTGRPEPILQALQEHPNDAGLWELLGEAYASAARYEEAVPAYRRSLALDSTESNTWWMLGITQVCRGDKAGVDEVTKELATRDHESFESYRDLAPKGCCAFGGCRTP